MKDDTPVIHLTIDGKAVTVSKGTTVYRAAQNLQIDIPIFCYHDRMPPFGACRMCLVEVEKSPKLQTSCTLEATDGMVVKTQSQLALDGQKGIVEFLLINHPLDCPICDRGGECPLQENALHHGPGKSRFYEEKRRFKKPIPLGPVLVLDRERCIVCARCTRFGDILAGDHALEFIDRGFKTEVGTKDGGPAMSKFIGNTIMICPVGALTSQVYRFRARPWDNDSTPTTCTLCPVGCSMILDSRDGEVVRTRSLENKEVNDIWLCDKGWFGYEFSSNEERLKKPLLRKNGSLVEVSWEEAIKFVGDKFKKAIPDGKLAAFSGSSLTLEEYYLLQQLMRKGANVNHIDTRLGSPLIPLEEEFLPPGMNMSIGEVGDLSFAILLGLDLTEEFPVIWLRLREAINIGAEVIFLGHFAPEIAGYFKNSVIHAPGQELELLKKHIPHFEALISTGKKGAIFLGSQYLHTKERASILSELSSLAKPHFSLNLLEGRGNSMGARFAGCRPDLLPFNVPLQNRGFTALEVLEEASKNSWDLIYVVGANPAVKVPKKLWESAKEHLGCLVVQDLFLTETAKVADVILPTLSFVEKEGSFVNIEGRVQPLRPGKNIPNGLFSDATIFHRIAHHLNMELLFDDNWMRHVKLGERLRLENHSDQKKTESSKNTSPLKASFAHALFDFGVRMQYNSHLVQMVKEPKARIHPMEGLKLNLKDEDEVRIRANGNTLLTKIQLDEKVASGTVVLPLGFKECPVYELGANLMNDMSVGVDKC